jgi:hypothetical protein
MSTTISIARSAPPAEPGYHVYQDCLGEMAAGEGKPPVYLCLDGVAVELQTRPSGGASVTITLPEHLARELGLLHLSPGA